MKQYETLDQVYEAANQYYENIMEDCFGGLHKLFAASYPNENREDVKQLFSVIAWELCKVKAEIERMKFLQDPDLIPERFIDHLAHMFGISSFPRYMYPEEKRRFISRAYEINKYKGTKVGLEMLLKVLLPFDEIRLFPMYQRGLRRYYENNDFTGGKRAGSSDSDYISKVIAGYPIDYRIAGPSTYPTGVVIGIVIKGNRTRNVVNGTINRVLPLIEEFIPENAFYEIRLITPVFEEHDVIFAGSNIYYNGQKLIYKGDTD